MGRYFHTADHHYAAFMRAVDLYGVPARKTGRDHAPPLSITDDLPEIGGGGSLIGSHDTPEAASDDEDGGDDDPDPARRPKNLIRPTPPFPPALLKFTPLSHYVGFGRSRIYQLINAGEFPAPIKIGKSSRWVLAEVERWIQKQIAARQSGNPQGG